MGIRFPGESAEYRAARDRLLEQEIELRRAMEAVAVARRRLPPGGIVPEDYVLRGRGADGNPTDVRLSELFAPGKDSLLIYSMMFPRDPGDERPGPPGGQTALLPLVEGPCPSCTALLDQLDGAAEHVSQRVNLVAVGKAPLSRILTFAEERGWRRLRLLSSAGSTYNRDYFGETADDHQRPMLNVFHRDGETIRHFWGSELLYAPTDPGQDPRHVGTIEPLWNLYDLTPIGSLSLIRPFMRRSWSVVYLAKRQAAEERERPDEGRGPLEEARLGRRLAAAGRATCARYCSMSD